MSWCAGHGLPHSALLEWDSEDRAKLLAFLLEEAGKCGMCGSYEHEWAGNPRAYRVESKVCPGCHLKSVAGEGDLSPGERLILVPDRG